MYQIDHRGPYSYVSRPPTPTECNHFIRNGYSPPDLVSERDANVYRYLRCEVPPNYPMPAIPLDVGIHADFVDICAYEFSALARRSLPRRQHWHRVKEWLK